MMSRSFGAFKGMIFNELYDMGKTTDKDITELISFYMDVRAYISENFKYDDYTLGVMSGMITKTLNRLGKTNHQDVVDAMKFITQIDDTFIEEF